MYLSGFFISSLPQICTTLQISDTFAEWATKWIKVEHEKQTCDQSLILKELTKQLEGFQTKLNILLDTYTDGLIDKDQFISQKKILEEKRSSAKNKLSELDRRTDNWILSAENTLDFARHAQERFSTGDWETKMLIITSLGSEFLMKDRKLYICLEKPYLIFKNNYDTIHAELPRVGLEDSLVTVGNTVVSNEIISKWWEGWDSNPHSRFFRPVH